jgi:hypothetical protein
VLLSSYGSHILHRTPHANTFKGLPPTILKTRRGKEFYCIYNAAFTVLITQSVPHSAIFLSMCVTYYPAFLFEGFFSGKGVGEGGGDGYYLRIS